MTNPNEGRRQALLNWEKGRKNQKKIKNRARDQQVLSPLFRSKRKGGKHRQPLSEKPLPIPGKGGSVEMTSGATVFCLKGTDRSEDKKGQPCMEKKKEFFAKAIKTPPLGRGKRQGKLSAVVVKERDDFGTNKRVGSKSEITSRNCKERKGGAIGRSSPKPRSGGGRSLFTGKARPVNVEFHVGKGRSYSVEAS